jgi:tetratricopeptide (TPR) repeat protein
MQRRGSAARCLALVLLTCSAQIAVSPPRPLLAADYQLGHDLPLLRAWLDAADRHLPGQADAPAVLVGSWSIPQLETVYFDFTALVQVLARPDAKPKLLKMVRGVTQAELVEYRQLAADQMNGLDPRDPRRADAVTRSVNGLVKRAALLHTDIALLVDSAADKLAHSTPAAVIDPRLTRRIIDAQQVGVEYYGSHWDVARLLLDQVRPAPAEDVAVRDWYRAVAAVFASRSFLAESHVHLARGEALFPADAEIARALGLLHEAEAAPTIQRFVESMPPGDSLRSAIGSARTNLRRAQSSHRKAVALDGDSAEAHLHLGRVTGLLGGHEEASRELRRAIDGAREPRTSYYAWLFLGVEEDALGRADAAREAFDRAAALYPGAQSPWLALSQLARRRGDRAAARRFMDEAWSRSSNDRLRDDPWTTYVSGPNAQPDALLADVRATLFLANAQR